MGRQHEGGYCGRRRGKYRHSDQAGLASVRPR